MGKTYRHLFFDLDHTLWDFEKNSEATMRRLFETYGLGEKCTTDFDTLFAAFNLHNDKLWDRYRKGYIRREELRWKRMWLMLLDFKIADTPLAHELGMAYIELLPTQTLLTPHSAEVLAYCKDKYRLHLITNGFEGTQKLKLHHSGIGHYFDLLITSEKSNCLKPQRAIFDYALSASGARVEESIMIGDALDIDIAGAINAGWDQVYYNPKGQPHTSAPTFEIRDMAELMNIF